MKRLLVVLAIATIVVAGCTAGTTQKVESLAPAVPSTSSADPGGNAAEVSVYLGAWNDAKDSISPQLDVLGAYLQAYPDATTVQTRGLAKLPDNFDTIYTKLGKVAVPKGLEGAQSQMLRAISIFRDTSQRLIDAVRDGDGEAVTKATDDMSQGADYVKQSSASIDLFQQQKSPQ